MELTARVPEGNTNIARNLDTDCGKLPPPECKLKVEKFCSIPPPPPSDDLECEAKIAATTMLYIGPDIDGVTVVFSGKNKKDDGGATYEKVNLEGLGVGPSSLVVGPGVAITKSDWTQSDVSKRQLDSGETRTLEVVFTQKGDRDGWLAIADLGGLTFKEGCEVEFPAVGGCELGKPTALVFEYTGDAFNATTNDQEGKFECEETGALGSLVSVEMTKDANKISVEITGNEVKIFYDDPEGKKFKSEIEYKITGSTDETQSQTLHTSCSKPLNVGDIFGAF